MFSGLIPHMDVLGMETVEAMNGVMMQTSEKLESGTHVRMGIEVGSDVLRTMAIVRRIIPGVGVAFEFAQMTQRDRQILGRLILQLKLSSKA